MHAIALLDEPEPEIPPVRTAMCLQIIEPVLGGGSKRVLPNALIRAVNSWLD